MIFDFVNLQYVYIYSLVAAIFKIVPLISTWNLGVVAAI